MLPFRSLVPIVAVAFLGGLPTLVHGQLNITCSASPEVCKLLAEEFQKGTGINATLVATPGGRAPLATLAEQKGKPESDVWLGGAAEEHYRAGKFDLLDTYASPLATQLQPWAQKVAEQSKSRSYGMYASVLGIGYNANLATQKKLAAPACWRDLAKPGYAGEVHLTDPSQSGATFLAIAAMSEIFGEEQAFNYLKAMYKAPPATKKSGRSDGKMPMGVAAPLGAKGAGKGPSAKADAGEAATAAAAVGGAMAGIAFVGDIIAEADAGMPVRAVAPCEGTVYEIGAISIVKGAKNLDNARKFVDWVLGAMAQALLVKATRAYPASTAVMSAPGAPQFSEIKFIDDGLAKYEKSAMRRQLSTRWNQEIAAAAH